MQTEEVKNDKTEELDKTLRIMEVVETELEQQKNDSIFCLLVFICSLSIWIVLVELWETLGRPVSETIMTVGVEVIAALMLVVILKFTRLDIRKMGITRKNLKPSIVRALIFSAAAAALMVSYKLLVKHGQLTLDWSEFSAAYLLTAVLQEFLARGFLVTTLQSITPSKNSGHIAVFSSSLMFMCLHLYYGLFFMLGAGALSVILGYCYLKDRNIWGVSIIHFVIGTAGVVLGVV